VRGLVARPVVVPPRGDQRRRLEQHGGEVDSQELDLLVGVVGGHLVHPDEVWQRRVDQIQPDGTAGPAGIRPIGTGRLARDRDRDRDRFEALPVGKMAEGRMASGSSASDPP
jgi:hypothetical protein